MVQKRQEEKVTKEIKRCGLYVRVSTDRQAQIKEGSLDTQLDRLRSYVKIRNCPDVEWKIIEEYREEGKSGKNTDRPEYQRMLNDIKSEKINTMICTKIDRATRSLLDFYKLYELLQQKNGDFLSLEESVDTSTPSGRAMLKITLVFAELEREQTSKRVKDKMQWRAEQGLCNGGRVLGYDVDLENKGIVKPNKEESLLVNLIFKTYLSCGSILKAAQIINKKGYRTKGYTSRRGNVHGGNKFMNTTISHILQNYLYIGKVTHIGDVFEGKHEPIVPLNLWSEVQTRIKENAPKRVNFREQKKHTFLLEGLLQCGWCGSYMSPKYCTGRKGKLYYYYQCSKNNHQGKEECGMKYVPAEELEKIIVERIKAIRDKEEFLSKIITDANKSSREQIKILTERKQIQENKLKNLQQKIDNWVYHLSKTKKTSSTEPILEEWVYAVSCG